MSTLIENKVITLTNSSSSHGDTSFRDSNSQINGSKRSWNKISEITRNMAIGPTVSTPLKMRVRLVPGREQVCTGNGIRIPT